MRRLRLEEGECYLTTCGSPGRRRRAFELPLTMPNSSQAHVSGPVSLATDGARCPPLSSVQFGLAVRFTLAARFAFGHAIALERPHSSIDAQLRIPVSHIPVGCFAIGAIWIWKIFGRSCANPAARRPGRLLRQRALRTAGGGNRQLFRCGIGMPYEWFHLPGSVRAAVIAQTGRAGSPRFSAQALGGAVTVRFISIFKAFDSAWTHMRKVSISPRVFAAVNNATAFPITPLHWGGHHADVQAVTTWTADFKDLDSRGSSLWAPRPDARAGEIPVNARIDYHYSMAARDVALAASEISTPTSKVQFNGTLLAQDSSLEHRLRFAGFGPWDDFINRLRGKRRRT